MAAGGETSSAFRLLVTHWFQGIVMLLTPADPTKEEAPFCSPVAPYPLPCSISDHSQQLCRNQQCHQDQEQPQVEGNHTGSSNSGQALIDLLHHCMKLVLMQIKGKPYH